MDVVWSAALNGTVRNATYTLEPAAPGVLNTSYELFSLPVEETYYILDYTEDGSYLLYFYCGSLLGSEYTGAVSASCRAARTPPRPNMARFRAARTPPRPQRAARRPAAAAVLAGRSRRR